MRRRTHRLGGFLLIALLALLAWTGSASAIVGYQWSGGSTTSSHWSDTGNWTSGSPSGSVDTLVFPGLTSCASPHACFTSDNDVAGITLNNLDLTSSTDSYTINGDGITLDSQLNVSAGSAPQTIGMPLTLGADNTWSIADDLSLTSALAGSHKLDVTLTGNSGVGSVLSLTGPNEIGDVSVSGHDTTLTGLGAADNGILALTGPASLNSTDLNPITLTDAAMTGAGQIAGLTLVGGELQPGNNAGMSAPGNVLLQGPLSVNGSSALEFTLKNGSASPSPGVDFAQVRSGSNMTLSLGPTLAVALNHSTCPTLAVGSVYTLMQTTGTISGVFHGVPDGGTITTQSTVGCTKQFTLRINYTGHAVTATVLAAPPSGGGGTPSGGGSPSVTPSNQTPPANTGGSTGGTVTVTAAQLKTLLLSDLLPHGKGAKIGALLKAGGYALTFKAPEGGTAQLNWYYLPPGAHIARAHAKPMLVASGKVSLSGPGSGTLTIRLTRVGRRLLKHARKLKLTGRGSFTPHGGTAVVAKKTFSVKR